LKGLEELGLKDKIKAIYGISAGAMLASYWAAGYSADEIFQKFSNTKKILNIYTINFLSKKSLFKSNGLHDQFQKDLPKDISKLSKKVYIGTTDTNTGTFKLFSQGNLATILSGSIAIPGIFPVVPYEEYVLMDGGVTNNFPVDIAKRCYPKDDIIGISLNRFKQHQAIRNVIDTLTVTFEIFVRNSAVERRKLVDHPFYNAMPMKILDTNPAKMKKAFNQGYHECLNHFKK
jgi:NTE family protein